MINNMNTKEAPTLSVDREFVSTISVMDIIPRSSPYEYTGKVPRNLRQAMGRAAIDAAVGIVLKPIDLPIHSPDDEQDNTINPKKVTSLSEDVIALPPRKKNNTAKAPSIYAKPLFDMDLDTKQVAKSSRRPERSKKQEKEKGPSRLSKIAGRIAVARTTALATTSTVARTATSAAIDLSKNAFTRIPDTQVAPVAPEEPVAHLSAETLSVAPVVTKRFIPYHNDLTGMLDDEFAEIDYPDDLMAMIDDAFAEVDYPDDLTGMLDDEFAEIHDSEDLVGAIVDASAEIPSPEDIPERQRRVRGLLSRSALRMTVGVSLIAAIGILSGSSQPAQAEHQTDMIVTAAAEISAAPEAPAVDGMQIVALPEQSPSHYIIATPAPEVAPAPANPDGAVVKPAPHTEAVSSAPIHTKTPAPAPTYNNNPPKDSDYGYNGSVEASQTPVYKKVSPSGNREIITFVTGGATDDSSEMFLKTLVDTGNVDPTKTKLIPTVSPKDMAPFAGGSLSTDQSVALTKEALMNNIRAELARNPNAEIHLSNFSEGNMGGNAVAQELLKEGINVQVTAYGNPESAIGMQNKSSAASSIVKPVMDNLGIVEIPNIPGTVNVADAEDMWATTAGDGGLTTLEKFAKIPTNHRVVDTVHETPIQSFKIGSETYLIYGDPNKLVAIPPNATDVKGPDAPEFHKFRPDAAPNNIDVGSGQGAPLPGPTALPSPDPTLVTLPLPGAQPDPDIAQPPSAFDLEKSLTPSFFGEQPCVAPDGSQYFTPANAPC